MIGVVLVVDTKHDEGYNYYSTYNDHYNASKGLRRGGCGCSRPANRAQRSRGILRPMRLVLSALSAAQF
jgi:hypothetical protein